MAYLSNLAKVTGLASTTIRQRNDSLPESSPISRSSTQSGSGPESPTDRITRGRNRSSPAKDAALHKVNGGKIAKPSNDKHNRRSSFWSGLASFFGSSKTTEGDDLDGDTIVNSDDSMETVEQDDDDTLVPHRPRRAELLYKTALEGRKRHRDEQVLRSDAPPPTQWTGDESRLVANIKTRGRKPLFDRTWFMDFSYFPDSAFTADPDEALIKHNHCTIYRAIRAMTRLCEAGPLVRGQLTSGAVPEKPLHRAINEYYKWTLADAKLEHKAHIPVTAIVRAKSNEPTESALNRLTDALRDLGRQYRDKWRHPKFKESDNNQIFTHPMPTLVGFLVKYTVSAIVSLDSSVPRNPVRTLHTGDWSVVNQDAWHAMAIAIAFAQQKEYLMKLDAEGELGPEVDDEGDDPDA